MKVTFLAAASSLFLAAAGHAAVIRPAPSPSCMAGSALTRVDYLVGSEPGCCDGKLRCTQYLATTKLARGHLDPHT